MLLCGILQLISMQSNKTKEKKFELFGENKRKQFFHLINLSLLALITNSLLFCVISSELTIEISKSNQIVMCLILSYLCLNIKNYKHHYVSIIVVYIISALICISKLIINSNEKLTIIDISLVQLFYFLYTSMEVYEKWIMRNYIFPPYLLLFCKGITSLLLYSILWIIFYCIPYMKTQYIDYNYIFSNIFYLFLNLIFSFSLHIFRIQTLFIFTPTYRYIADISVLFYLFLFRLNTVKYSPLVFILFCIGYIMIICSICIYMEIFILNIWGMNENTLKQINLRADNEKPDTFISLLEEKGNERLNPTINEF